MHGIIVQIVATLGLWFGLTEISRKLTSPSPSGCANGCDISKRPPLNSNMGDDVLKISLKSLLFGRS